MGDVENKKWWQSKTVISAFVALIGGIGTIFGYEIAPEEQGEIVEIVSQVLVLGGSIGAVVGRVKASKKIGK